MADPVRRVPGERRAVVAGTFYPGGRAELEAAIDAYVARARAPLGARPVALVAPHAGIQYCGAVLAEAWHQASQWQWDLVVLIGTPHTVPDLDRMAVWTSGPWRTPLGTAPVDEAAAAALLAADPRGCTADPAAQRDEHSIEVHVPWVQRLLPGVAILPVVAGDGDAVHGERFTRTLAGVLRDRRALIVASSDLSHYPAAADAERVDGETLAAIASLDPAAFRSAIAAAKRRRIPGLVTCACGEAPILAAMGAARALGAVRGTVLACAHSGQRPGGDPRRVVGYGAVSLTAESAPRAGAAPPEC